MTLRGEKDDHPADASDDAGACGFAAEASAPDPLSGTRILQMAAFVFQDDAMLAQDLKVPLATLGAWLAGKAAPPHDAVMRAIAILGTRIERLRRALQERDPI